MMQDLPLILRDGTYNYVDEQLGYLERSCHTLTRSAAQIKATEAREALEEAARSLSWLRVFRRDVRYARCGMSAATDGQRTMQVLRWRRRSHSTNQEQADGFDWREIACTSVDAAKAEAERQQSLDARDAEWIYLRNANGQWVARRTPRDLQAPPISMRRAFLEWLVNPFDSLGS